LISLVVFVLIFGGALVGVMVRPLLSEQHLNPDSRDVVKMATGLIGTLTPLVPDRFWSTWLRFHAGQAQHPGLRGQ
jgi:hypothetical protein